MDQKTHEYRLSQWETTTDAPNFKPPAVPNKKKTKVVL